jgi:hypothetical protein
MQSRRRSGYAGKAACLQVKAHRQNLNLVSGFNCHQHQENSMAVKAKYLSIMSAAVIAAATLGAGTVHAESSNKGAAHSKNMGEAGANTMDAAGKTQANREGRMSPTGENATSSVAPKTGTPAGK